MSAVTTPAAADVLAERQRQITDEGWTPAHDDKHTYGELVQAAADLCVDGTDFRVVDMDGDQIIGWGLNERHKDDRRRQLVIAGALILAEIERLDRAKGARAPVQASPTTTLTGQILVMATLLEKALRVVKNVEAEGSDEGELLQALIDQGEAAIATVLKEHAMGVPSHG
jgi:hypothetical protein